MICIIPQHATSVRLPRKAFREICGIPLVAWSVIQAKAAHCIDEVYVSTESPEIAEICEQYGAKIIWRPGWLQDKAFAANVPFEHALDVLDLHTTHEPFLCKLATSPLLFPDDIDRLYERFQEAEDMPIGVGKQVVLGAEVQEVVSYRRIRKPEEKICIMHYVDKSKKAIIPAGAMNIMWADRYRESNRKVEWYFESTAIKDDEVDGDIVTYAMILGTAMLYYVPCRAWQTYDIDDDQDLEMVELFMEHKILKGRGPEVYYEYGKEK
ncbi:MAG: NTP transferase domain-containing protein [Deltaproteobacteria bacterium]|nr:NTP transferase domain-containing protein [Deltaproteobacteria bacterium]